MTDNQRQLVLQHVTVPVCGTFHGCIEHVRFMGLAMRWQLAFHFDCDPEQLPRKLWNTVKQTKCGKLLN